MENYKQDFLQSCLLIYHSEEKMHKKWTHSVLLWQIN